MPTPSASDYAPRRVPPEQALPEPQIGASQAAVAGTAAALAGTAAGTAAGVAATAPVVPLVGGALKTVEEIITSFTLFFVTMRARQERWLLANMRKPRGVIVPAQDIYDTIGDESTWGAMFQARVIERVRRDATRALSLPTRAQQRAAIERLIDRERRFARQRSEAMAVRALAALDRVVLRAESPEGACWRLGRADKHTPDCVFMARYKFWPWEALARLRPPVHTGCKCSLHSKADALRRGWMTERDVQPVPVAMRRVAAALAMVHETEIEDVLSLIVAETRLDAADFDRILFDVAGVG